MSLSAGGAGPRAPLDGERLYQLGRRFYLGDGLKQDTAAALGWMQLAAEAGHARAMAWVATAYRRGWATPVNEAKERVWVRRAADAGDPCSIGRCFHDGVGCPVDVARAVAFYREAAALGDATAMNALGFCYAEGLGGLTRDLGQARHWFRRATELGDSAGINNFAYTVEHGDGAPADPQHAFRLYSLAAARGDSDAMMNLGMCYGDGIGVGADMAMALRWYQAAARLDQPGAYYNVGLLHEVGRAGPRNLPDAVDAYTHAADLGFDKARSRLCLPALVAVPRLERAHAADAQTSPARPPPLASAVR